MLVRCSGLDLQYLKWLLSAQDIYHVSWYYIVAQTNYCSLELYTIISNSTAVNKSTYHSASWLFHHYFQLIIQCIQYFCCCCAFNPSHSLLHSHPLKSIFVCRTKCWKQFRIWIIKTNANLLRESPKGFYCAPSQAHCVNVLRSQTKQACDLCLR